MKSKIVVLISAILFIASHSIAQSTIFFQGFEGPSTCNENWAYTGGNVTTQTSRTGTSSARIGRSGESNTLTFNSINIAGLSGVQLQLYHSVRSGSGPGMDTREGAVILVSLNGGTYNVIGRAGGNADAAWAWTNTSGGVTNTCSQTYTMTNPLNYAVPIGTLTLQLKIVSVNGGSNCTTFQTSMTNGTAANYDRTDEGFFIDDVKLTTTSTGIPGIWTGAINSDWFNCANWHNAKIPSSQSDIIISDIAAINNCVVSVGGAAVCRNITISSVTNSTPDLIVQNASSLISSGNLIIIKLLGSGVSKAEILSGSTFSCNDVTLSGTSSGATNASFVNEFSTNTVTFNGSLNLNSGGELDLTQAGNFGILNLKGNYNNNGLESDFKQTNSIVVLNGTSNQSINTNSFNEVFSTLNLNKSSGQVILSDNIQVESQLNLQNGLMDLNSHTLTILTNLTTGITRLNGGIISEKNNNSSKINWQIGTQIGNFIFPFSRADATYIPLIFSLTAGDAGTVTVSTYGTPASNLPWPSSPVTVTNLFNSSFMDNSQACVDRFWEIDVTGSPIANVTFNYAANELPVSPYNNSNAMQAQIYDKISNVWLSYLPSQLSSSFSVVVPAISTFSTAFALSNTISTLPIELLNFSSVLNVDHFELLWTTLSEVNNDYFEIEWSTDGVNFSNYGRVPGAGNSTTLQNYSFVVSKPLNSNTYFRLKQVDFDGRFSYSKILVLNFKEAEISIQLFPNPVSDKLYLQLGNNFNTTIDLSILDITGNCYYQKKIEQPASLLILDLTEFTSGVYVVKLLSTQNLYSAKFYLIR